MMYFIFENLNETNLAKFLMIFRSFDEGAFRFAHEAGRRGHVTWYWKVGTDLKTSINEMSVCKSRLLGCLGSFDNMARANESYLIPEEAVYSF